MSRVFTFNVSEFICLHLLCLYLSYLTSYIFTSYILTPYVFPLKASRLPLPYPLLSCQPSLCILHIITTPSFLSSPNNLISC